MSKLMLIDAAHPEETRVTVVADGQIEDFDFEARDKRQLRGNIYLAKVTRVEPSLQAAFVEYGGNRHGFLAFSEIHPDYYQIPKEDREALLAEEMAASQHDEDDVDDEVGINADTEEDAAISDEQSEETAALDSSADDVIVDEDTDTSSDDTDDEEGQSKPRKAKPRRQKPSRRYKIQEVIKRRQVLLIQVVKEERGNKGAAVTTYLSLAGRYGVLMPNTARGGGISRKIANAVDRKRLKKIMGEFSVPEGMGLIIRTAGAKRTKSEISRDYDYLIRLWSTIRDQTLDSMAPCLIHEEGDLVLRAIRDLYDRDVDNIIVEGKDAYVQAKNVISMLMPDHAEKVIEHNQKTPLFISQGVEAQLDNIFSPVVQLPSGGYLVINQTEALVAVDVNSGKATRERNIEATAVKTNLEAAAEVCRQMRLRDLAGLVVIDFIDMEENKNNRAVEKKMKDCLTIDRARVQTGRISQFGLFEISRQRRRAGVLELSSEPCKACHGTGRNRSIESAALQLLRAIEERGADERVDNVAAKAPSEVALYILNHKRDSITSMEASTGAHILISADTEMMPGDFAIEATGDGNIIAYKPIVPIDATPKKRRRNKHEDVDAEEATEAKDTNDPVDEDDEDENSRRRRRGRRGGRRRRGNENGAETSTDGMEVIDGDSEQEDGNSEEASSKSRRSRRRRPRRRTPDVAVDGGEMLDAVASAPFLAIETPEEEDEEATTNDQSEKNTAPSNESGNENNRSRNGKKRRRRRQHSNSENSENVGTENPEQKTVSEVEDKKVADDTGASDQETNKEADKAAPEFVSETSNEAVEEKIVAPAEVIEDKTSSVAEAEVVAETADKAIAPPPAPEKADTPELETVSETVVAQEAEPTPALHALHGDTTPAKKKAPKKRRIGWWNKK